jgi:hypothetical protein
MENRGGRHAAEESIMQSRNGRDKRVLIGVVASAVLALAGAGAAVAAVSIEDVRARQEPLQVRNSAGGAEIDVSERQFKKRVIDGLAKRLAEAHPQLDGRSARLTRASAVLFVEGAFGTPAIISSNAAIREAGQRAFPDDLPVLKQSGVSGRREYRVELALEIDGRTIEAQGKSRFMSSASESLQLRKAVDAAIEDAVAKVAAPAG